MYLAYYSGCNPCLDLPKTSISSLWESSGYLENLIKLRVTSQIESLSKSLPRRRLGQHQLSCKGRQWSSSLQMMANNVGNSRLHEKKPSARITEEKKPIENASTFVNQAALAWHETRREWVGDQSQKQRRVPKDPVISWSMTYEDLLSTGDRFPQRIPLPEMVDFLVDIWHDEGLFD